MNRLISGMVPLVALVMVAGCSGDPTDPLRGGVSKLVASPSQLFIEPGGTKTVEVGAVDEQGNPLSEAYVVSSVGSGITVKRDSSFLPIFDASGNLVVPPTAPRFRFIVQADPGNNFGATSFTVSAAGNDLAIPVQVAPIATLEATFSNLTPALGEEITITAPTGVKFTPTATLEFPGAPLQPIILSRSPDSTSITFIAPPNAGGPLKVNGVLSPSVPGVVLAPTTTLSLTTPLIDTVDAVFSTTTPTVGQTVTLTLPALMKFGGHATAGLVVALNFQQQAASPAAITVAPDSQSLTFQAPPNAAGVARVDSVIFPGGYAISLPTRAVVAGASIGTTATVTFSSLNPAIGQVITATATGNFRFTQGTSLTLDFGGKIGAIQSRSADSTQVSFLPLPGTGAPATITGLRYTPAPQFLVTLPTVDTVRVPEITPLPNADDIQTAPSIAFPGPGATTTLFDAGPYNGSGDCCFGGPTRLYKLVVTATADLTFTVDWFEGQDLGVYITESDGVTIADGGNAIGDDAGEGPTGHPESVTATLAPGTYFVAIPNFSATNPSLIKITIDRP